MVQCVVYGFGGLIWFRIVMLDEVHEIMVVLYVFLGTSSLALLVFLLPLIKSSIYLVNLIQRLVS